MTAVKPMTAFILVNDKGWAIPSSTNYTATQVRTWCDKNWDFNGGYETAKKEGWRVRKIWIADFKEPTP